MKRGGKKIHEDKEGRGGRKRHLYVCVCIERERERERERQTDRQTETDTQAETERGGERGGEHHNIKRDDLV